MSGVSLQYTFAGADEPGRKRVQYFEMMGHRDIYADGWKAVTRHQPGVPFEDDDWELYHLDEDRSECANLAAAQPEKVAELIELWWREAEEYGVLPLDDRTIELFFTRYRDRSPHPTSRRYTYYPPMAPLPAQVAPALGGRGWNLGHDRPPRGRRRGPVRLGHGELRGQPVRPGRPAGLRLQLLRRPSPGGVGGPGPRGPLGGRRAVPPEGPGRRGHPGHRRPPVGILSVPFAMTMISSVGPSVGYDHGSPVSERYRGSFPFEGELDRLEITLTRQPASAHDAEGAERAAMSRQ